MRFAVSGIILLLACLVAINFSKHNEVYILDCLQLTRPVLQTYNTPTLRMWLLRVAMCLRA
jgi:hypothetical protein